MTETYSKDAEQLKVETPQPIKVERFSLELIEARMADCNRNITRYQTELALWTKRKAEAEKLGLKVSNINELGDVI